MGTAIKHPIKQPVPDWVKLSFIIFDIRALWRSAPSIRENSWIIQEFHSDMLWVWLSAELTNTQLSPQYVTMNLQQDVHWLITLRCARAGASVADIVVHRRRRNHPIHKATHKITTAYITSVSVNVTVQILLQDFLMISSMERKQTYHTVLWVRSFTCRWVCVRSILDNNHRCSCD